MDTHKINTTVSEFGGKFVAVSSFAGQLPPRGQDRLPAFDHEHDAILASVSHLFTHAARESAARIAAVPLGQRGSQHVYACGANI